MEGRHVLVVEDDPAIALGLRINLEAEGYRVTLADDGERGLQVIRAERPDLVVLDVMLPRKNGFEVMHELRAEGISVPIIVLSARTGEMDKVTGLELGAEDYVAKPFSLAELLARVRVALRRLGRAAPKAELVRFSSVEVDVSARSVRHRGALVELTATEFDVLMCLVENRGKALSRDDIFRRVWGPNHHGTPRTIDNFMQQLRQKLEDDPTNPRHFLTVRGIGYRFDG
ncbi:MAG: response regulator transcription factor [Myxococcales bacterium]|nr:response regulator transcription factor [Myxococcales bacterium]